METSVPTTNSDTSLLSHQLVPCDENEDDGTDVVYSYDYPIGCRFQPKDHELIEEYLFKKVLKKPLPMYEIKEINVYNYNPSRLANMYEEDEDGKMHYFFTSRDKKYLNGARPNRAAGDGYWKATGKDKDIFSQKTNRLIGKKKTLVFYKGKQPNGKKTSWIMHEYRLEPAVPRNRLGKSMELDQVLVRIYNRSAQEDETNSVDENNEQVVNSVSSEKEQNINSGSSPVISENHMFCGFDVKEDAFYDEYKGDAILDLMNGDPSMEKGLNELYGTFLQNPNPSWSNVLEAGYQPHPIAVAPMEYPMTNVGYFLPPNIPFNTM
ncbi:hypothetical protein ACHQM5_005929 [Ranunculus cassubicifolius]